MANNIASVGQMAYSYGSHTWDFGPRTKSHVKIDYVSDEADRTIIWSEYLISTKTYVSETIPPFVGMSLGEKMQILTNVLSHSGGELLYNVDGNSLQFNTEQSNRDLKFGPTPISLEYETVGGTTNIVTWVVKARRMDCTGAANKGIVEKNYTVELAVDRNGYLTKTYSGFLRIANARQGPGSRLPFDNPDSPLWREQWVVPVALGFRRESCRRTVSADRTRLDWVIVDVEMPAPLQEGVTFCKARHSVRTDGLTATVGLATIAATYTMCKGRTKADAHTRFILLVESKIGPVFGNNRKAAVFYTGFSLDDDVFGEGISFTLNYRINSASLEELLALSGWTNGVKGADPSIWRRTLNAQQDPSLGRLALTFKSELDPIVDLCQTAAPPQSPDGMNKGKENGKLQVVKKGKPNKERSWDSYENFITYEKQDGVVWHKILSENGSGSSLSTQQRWDEPIYKVVMWGSAVRVGYPIDPPSLVLLEKGIDAVNAAARVQASALALAGISTAAPQQRSPKLLFQGGSFTPVIRGCDLNGNPIWSATWSFTYLLTGTPNDLKSLKNPLVEGDSSAKTLFPLDTEGDGDMPGI